MTKLIKNVGNINLMKKKKIQNLDFLKLKLKSIKCRQHIFTYMHFQNDKNYIIF